MVKKTEYLLDSLAEYLGSHDPSNTAYKKRNPLALREVQVHRDRQTGLKVVKFGELREFTSWANGYNSGLYDLEIQCSGRSQSSGLTSYSSLEDLVKYYGMKDSAANVADYLSYALEDEGITPESKLFIFLK